MADPVRVEEIIAAVIDPGDGKGVHRPLRRGAKILQALGVDYIDEAKCSPPADEAHHIDKWQFTVPFVCGAWGPRRSAHAVSEKVPR